jgi:hypothetical protein
MDIDVIELHPPAIWPDLLGAIGRNSDDLKGKEMKRGKI